MTIIHKPSLSNVMEGVTPSKALEIAVEYRVADYGLDSIARMRSKVLENILAQLLETLITKGLLDEYEVVGMLDCPLLRVGQPYDPSAKLQKIPGYKT